MIYEPKAVTNFSLAGPFEFGTPIRFFCGVGHGAVFLLDDAQPSLNPGVHLWCTQCSEDGEGTENNPKPRWEPTPNRPTLNDWEQPSRIKNGSGEKGYDPRDRCPNDERSDRDREHHDADRDHLEHPFKAGLAAE
jgi:hypothetical protein